jgi:hypothetical protein
LPLLSKLNNAGELIGLIAENTLKGEEELATKITLEGYHCKRAQLRRHLWAR